MRKLAPQVTRIHQLARTLRRNQTIAEKQLWTRLCSAQMASFKFRGQFPVGDFIADFCSKESRLVVELDGVHHADDPAQVDADRRRADLLQARGYRLVRFWNDEVLSNLDGVLEQILAEIKNPPPHHYR
jgi:very-short-patch-repair endonuclease